MQRRHPVVQFQIEHQHLIVEAREAQFHELLQEGVERGVELRRGRAIRPRGERGAHPLDLVDGVMNR